MAPRPLPDVDLFLPGLPWDLTQTKPHVAQSRRFKQDPKWPFSEDPPCLGNGMAISTKPLSGAGLLLSRSRSRCASAERDHKERERETSGAPLARCVRSGKHDKTPERGRPSTPRPSRCSSARSPSARRRSGRSTPTPRHQERRGLARRLARGGRPVINRGARPPRPAPCKLLRVTRRRGRAAPPV